MPNPENLEGQGFHTNPDRINRDGRPKGSRNRSTIVREAIEAILKGTGQQVVDSMTAAIIEKAMGGDVPAFKELMDSAYGKVADKVIADVKSEVTSTDVTKDVLATLTTEQLEALLAKSKDNG